RRLLSEAGYEDDLEVELVTSDINAGVVAAAEVFEEQAREAGVTVNLRRVNPSDYWNEEEGVPYACGQARAAARNYSPRAAQGSSAGPPYDRGRAGAHEEGLGYLGAGQRCHDADERNELRR